MTQFFFFPLRFVPLPSPRLLPVVWRTAYVIKKDLGGLGKAHSIVLTVKHGIVLANEYISQNPQGPGRRGDLQTHESTQADGLPALVLLRAQEQKHEFHTSSASNYALPDKEPI